MKIAVEGCCHDQLEVIYDTIEHIEKTKGEKVDLLLICGDFQATRNPSDLLCMAMPAKYRGMNYFWKYYKKEKTAPILTIVIGGNHEVSNYMQELGYGGWLAPNIYYLGYAGIVNVGGVRIGGMSGISKGRDYHKGHFEHPPYSQDSLRSAYHVRSFEVFRLKQVKEPVDIMMSHDWPKGVVYGGNIEHICRKKPDFRDEIMSDGFSSVPGQEVLNHIRPKYWFAAHFHIKYAAVVEHQPRNSEEEKKITNFLALDKCLPHRPFLQLFDFPTTQNGPYKLELDAEWLCILKSTNHLLNITSNASYMPGIGCKERYDFTVTEEEKKNLLEDFGNDLTIPENFSITVDTYDGKGDISNPKEPKCMVNPQTTLLCQMLGLTDPFAVFCGATSDPSEIQLSDSDSDGIDFESSTEEDNSQSAAASASSSQAGDESSATEHASPADTLGTSNISKTVVQSMSVDETELRTDKPYHEESGVKRTSMKLPPVQSASDTSEHSKVETDSKPIVTEQGNSNICDKKTQAEESGTSNLEKQPAPSPERKKMKRRNVAMYCITKGQEDGEDCS